MLGHLQRLFGPANLTDITPLRVEGYQNKRVQEVCPATVNRELALLKHMFNMAERWSLAHGPNPVRLVKFLPEDNLQFQTLTEEEEQALVTACPPYLQGMIVFAINTGLRSGDIFKLRWEEVDLEHRRLKLLVRKTRRMLELPLNEVAYAVLEGVSGIRKGPFV